MLPPAFAHRSATADILLTMPASATDAAHKLKKMFQAGKAGVAGLPRRVTEGGDPTPPPVPETPAQAEGRWAGGRGWWLQGAQQLWVGTLRLAAAQGHSILPLSRPH